MTGEGLFISTLNYQKHDREQISNTIPSGCKADLKLCHQSCAVLKEKTSALLAKNTNTMRGRARPESYHFPPDFCLLQSAERCYG